MGETFVANCLNTISQGEAIYSRIPQGICRYQDLYLVTRSPQKPWSSLKFSHHPQGKIEQCELTSEGNLLLKGWVSEINPHSQLEEMLVFLNGTLIPNCLLSIQPSATESQWSWSCQVPLGENSQQAIILIKAVNSPGLEWVFETTTVETLIQIYSNPI